MKKRSKGFLALGIFLSLISVKILVLYGFGTILINKPWVPFLVAMLICGITVIAVYWHSIKKKGMYTIDDIEEGVEIKILFVVLIGNNANPTIKVITSFSRDNDNYLFFFSMNQFNSGPGKFPRVGESYEKWTDKLHLVYEED